jgi:3',5'-cyclic-AMP phosphodiesterase
MRDVRFSRRQFTKALGVGVGLAAMGSLSCTTTPEDGSKSTDPIPASELRSMRVLHISDMHVQRALDGDKGFAQALNHAKAHAGRIDWVLNTGDCVYEGVTVDKRTMTENWILWHSVMQANCTWPAEHVIGNHDIYGWDQAKSGALKTDPDFGKGLALKELTLPDPCRVFDQSGWRFIVLDTVQQRKDTFTCRSANKQFEWFKEQLAQAPKDMPVCVVTHVPILSVAAGLYLNRPENEDGLYTPWFLQCTDAKRLSDAIAASGKVKVCLAGHTHMIERVDYKGTAYITHGAVSGNKWAGATQGFGSTYGVVEFFPDGRFNSYPMDAGWKFKT